MKKILFIINLILFSSIGFTQHINLTNSINSFKVLSSSKTELIIENQLNTIDYTKVFSVEGLMYDLKVEGYATSLEVGSPKLPILKQLIEVPEGAEVLIEIIESDYKVINLSDYGISNYLMPKLKSTSKNQIPEFYLNKTIYRTDDYFQNNLASIESLGIMRSTHLARLSISPIAYNPVKNTLKIFDKVKIKISFQNANLAATKALKEKYYSPFFNSEQDGVLNADAFAYLPTNSSNYAIKYVIVADSMFRNSLQSFIKWKQKKGFQVVEAYTNNPLVGNTTTSIKSYLKSLYLNASPTNPAPTFVLLVGDTTQLTVFSGVSQPGHFTDLYFCEYTNDAFPDVLYGRISATDSIQLRVQLNKTIEYEKYLMNDPSFLGKSVMIAGVDNNYGPTHANPQINYATTNYFNAAHSQNAKIYLYPSSGNNDALIIADVSSGAGIVNYTAHGSYLGWSDPEFSVSDVNGLTNAGKYPLMIGNACETSRFEKSVCFGEAVTRAANKGAIAYIGASNSSFWDEDYYWSVGFKTVSSSATYSPTNLGAYDCMFHDHGESFSKWAMTNAQIIKAGNLAVTQSGNNILYYWEIYHLLGDPSLMVYQKVPSTISATFSPIIPLGIGTFTVSTVPHALVAISRNDSLISSSFADSLGVANLNYATNLSAGSVDIVITAQNKKPYFSSAVVSNPTGPYIISKNIVINDSKSNNNNQAEANEDFSLDLTLSNITTFNSTGLRIVVKTVDTNVTIIDSVVNITSILANSDKNLDSVFKIKVKPFVLNNLIVPFTLTITDSNAVQWFGNFNVLLFSPNLKCNSIVINDAMGNNNGRIDPGESVQIIVNIENNGGADAFHVNSTLSCGNSGVQITGTSIIDTLKYSNSAQAIFNATIGVNVFNGSNLNFDFLAQSGLYKTQKTFIKSVGNVDEDFETNGFNKYSWVNSSVNPWIITQSNVYQGVYSARSKMNLNNQDTSKFEIAMNVLCDDSISFYRKVSSEEDYDYLIFMVDNLVIEKWSGEINWSRVSYPVSAGNHNFKWVYAKDYLDIGGGDVAFVDMISFPPNSSHVGIMNIPENENPIRVIPNPASTSVSLILNSDFNTQSKLTLFDVNGKQIKSVQEELFIGENTIHLDLQDIKSGIYNLQVFINNQVKNIKVAVIQ